MAMQWTTELRMGIADIERQHQAFYALANTLHDAMRAGRRDVLPAIVAQLGEFAACHFETEERHMRELRYPRLADHRVEHESFVSDLAAFEAALEGGVRASLLVDVSCFLTRWMREHIRGPDLAFGRFAAANEAPRPPPPPVARAAPRRASPLSLARVA